MSLVEILWPAFVLAIMLVFIHAIFGLEIIKRGVIFTDLAIGQIAAIGMAISVAFFAGEHQTLFTLFFAILAAVIIAYASKKIQKMEAFIGLLYALGISSMMLILAKSSEGMELFNKLSAADILFTLPQDLFGSFIVYALIAIVMFFLYPKTSGFIKELVFFISLGLTVTSSVQLAGVLVVFALLVAPAYAASSQNFTKPLVFAWIFGTIAIVVALIVSYLFDLPTGYTMIFSVVLSSLIFEFIMNLKKSHN